MNTISAETGRCILLGKYGDNAVTCVKFDVSEICGKYGAGGTFLLINQRSGEANGYPVNGVSVDGNILTWTVASSDLMVGSGRVQLQYSKNNAVLHTEIWETYCGESISGTGTVPSPWTPWVTQITNIKNAAVAAAGHYPYIDETTGNWFVWDVSGGVFVNSGVHAKGDTEAASAQTVTLAVADWNSGTTCTKSVTGVTADNIVFCDVSDSSVQCTAQGAGTLTFTATATPTAAVTVKAVILP